MDLSSLNPSFGVVASSGGTLTTATGTDTFETSLGQRHSASLPLSSSFNAAQSVSMQTSRKPSSHEFAEQIRQLEIEGSKLRTATVSALAQGSGLNGSGFGSPESKQVTSPLTTSLASLVDISSEQKTISDLRAQLENQRRETERLQSHLLADSSSGRTFSSLLFTSPTKSAFSTVPAAELSSVSKPPRRAFEFAPPSHMERSLKESQEQVVELRKKLQDAIESTEQQKRHFRANNEELKSKLHETIVNRDTVLELRQKESASQEALINKLQASLSQLQEKCRAQEQALGEMNKQAESSSQSCYATTMALSQLRAVLASRERARGRPYLEGDPASTSQSIAALVLTLEKCLQESDQEAESQKQRNVQLERELEELRKSSYEKEQALLREHQDRVSSVTFDQDRRLEEANERASNARQQTAALQNQLRMLEEQQQQQGRMKNETIGELEVKLKQLKQDYADDRSMWLEKRQALEMSLDEVQRELIQVKAERSEAVRNQAATETKTEDLQMLVSRLQGDLENERERVRQQREREEELRLKALTLEGQITHKQQEVERLERMLEVVKQEASLQMHDRVASTEKHERDRYTDQISTLTAQLTTANELKTKLAIENERLKMEAETLRQQLSDNRLDYQATRAQIEAANTERQLAIRQMEEEHGEVERLRQERDHYRRLTEEKGEEVVQLRSTVERATLQLEEKEKVLSTVRQQSTSISQLMEVNTRTSDNMREDREKLNQQLAAKIAAVEESKASQEAMSKKMKLRERRIRELEDERVKLVEEMSVRAQELSLLQQEKDSIFMELKESRVEVSRVTEAKDNLRREMARLKNFHAKEMDKLLKRSKEFEHDYKLTHKALRTKDSVDSKAVKVADQIQKEITAKRSEVDNLRSKCRRLEEKLETLTKEKLMVERDKDSLKSSLARSLLHTTQLTEELEASQVLSSKLQRRNKELEDAIDKEAIKCSSTQAQLEQFDQEVATMKLRHQLDLKEAAQLAQNKSSKVSWVPINDDFGRDALEQPQGSESSKNRNNSAVTPRSQKLSQKRGSPRLPQVPQESFTDAGKELKSLLGEMREMIHGQREINKQSKKRPTKEDQLSSRRSKNTRRRSRSSSTEKGSERSVSVATDVDRSLAFSYPPRSADFSGFSAGTGSRSTPASPRRAAYGGYGGSGWQEDVTPGSSYLSHGSQSDLSNLTTSFASPLLTKGGSAITLVPDTQELCRRLEEKIANLTRMGSNLQHENQEMAHLISAQGQKLEVVRKHERQMDNRR
ncbi:coiled-coil domain-containing protein 158-like [Littorina saxatilis]|uniref:coiled-coil domain-containing protein 158-like n=1 Tax=Littorina saxatilis TaxID=31220 RepID=UPI0038B490A8